MINEYKIQIEDYRLSRDAVEQSDLYKTMNRVSDSIHSFKLVTLTTPLDADRSENVKL
jgi:hypothetical protein